MPMLTDADNFTYDEEFDIVVVGYGFAGGAAAIEAADLGASVALVEKMPDPGGISICAGGGLRIAKDEDDAFNYMKATCYGRTDDEVLRAFAHGVANLAERLTELSKINNAVVGTRWRHGNFPFPGVHTWGYFEVKEIPGFEARTYYPHVRGRANGPMLFKMVEDNVKARPIDVRLSCPAKRLIRATDGTIRGIVVDENGTEKTIKARQGVILACGGFEADPSMQEQYWQLQPVQSAVSRGNTGDGIRMAQEAGADLWHMWHMHGSYGFRHTDPTFPTAIRMKRLPDWAPGITEPDVKMAWIVVDRRGRRYMNEYPPYSQDNSARDLDAYDTVTQTMPRVPSHLIVDEVGRQLYPLGQAVTNDRTTPPYDWSEDNLKEVENGILKKADSVEELAEILEVEPGELKKTLDRWNDFCAKQSDEDFGRSPKTMMEIKTPPFYTGELWPVVSNTQGGPRHDARQRVVTPFGDPIPRLYEAGELGSIWGFLYLGGGNLSECFISGRIAAQEAAALTPWDKT